MYREHREKRLGTAVPDEEELSSANTKGTTQVQECCLLRFE